MIKIFFAYFKNTLEFRPPQKKFGPFWEYRVFDENTA